jgi:hypothetical protein
VVNEHAGFADIIARHVAMELHLPRPPLSDLSSFAPFGRVANGSFEKSTLPGVADGWRPHGAVTLIENATKAMAGAKYLEVDDGAWVHFANGANPGDEYTVTGWMRGSKDGARGKLRLEFKDQGQHMIHAAEGLKTVTTRWQRFTTTASAPAKTWSVWVVLAAEKNETVHFDDVQLTRK